MLNENVTALKTLLYLSRNGILLLTLIVLKKHPATRHRFEDTIQDRQSLNVFSTLTEFFEKQISIVQTLETGCLPRINRAMVCVLCKCAHNCTSARIFR